MTISVSSQRKLDGILDRWDDEDLRRWLYRNLKNRCPECKENTLKRTEEGYVCERCGLVVEETPQIVNRLPFGETYALTSDLAYGKSLGGTLQKNDLFKVVAMSKNGKKDLGIRAIHLRTLLKAKETPQVRKLKNAVSSILKKYGLYTDKEYSIDSHKLGNIWSPSRTRRTIPSLRMDTTAHKL